MAKSLFPRPTGIVQIQQTVAAAVNEAVVTTESQLAQVLNSLAKLPNCYGRAVIIQGTITINTTVTLRNPCFDGLVIRGSGLVLAKDTAAFSIGADDMTIADLTLRRTGAGSQLLGLNSVGTGGDRLAVRNVRVLAAAAPSLFSVFFLSRPCSVGGCWFLPGATTANAIQVTGSTSTARIVDNDLGGQDIDTSGGTGSIIVANQNVGGGSSFDGTDVVANNT